MKIRENLKNHMTFNVLLTNRCNLNCQHCCNNSSYKNDGYGIPTDKALTLIKNASEYKARGICFTGGEVTLREDLPLLINAAYESNIESSFFTNGLLVNEELVNKIEGKITYVCVSLDGPEEYHDYIRNQSGVYRQAINAIKLLVSHNITTVIQYTVTRNNMQHLDWVIEKAHELKVSRLYFAPLQFFGRAIEMKDQMLTPSNLRYLYNKIVNARGRYLDLPIFYKGNLDTEFIKKHPCNIFACSGMSCHKVKPLFPDKINIGSDGKVYPLSSDIDAKFIMGNINDNTLLEIINNYSESSKLKELMELCSYVYFKHVKNYNFFTLPWFELLAEESKKDNYKNFKEVLEREVVLDPHPQGILHEHEHEHVYEHGHEHVHNHEDQNSAFKYGMII